MKGGKQFTYDRQASQLIASSFTSGDDIKQFTYVSLRVCVSGAY